MRTAIDLTVKWAAQVVHGEGDLLESSAEAGIFGVYDHPTLGRKVLHVTPNGRGLIPCEEEWIGFAFRVNGLELGQPQDSGTQNYSLGKAFYGVLDFGPDYVGKILAQFDALRAATHADTEIPDADPAPTTPALFPSDPVDFGFPVIEPFPPVRERQSLYVVHPPDAVAVPFALQEQDEIELHHELSGRGALRWRHGKGLNGWHVKLCGQESVFRWWKAKRQAVAIFTALQMKAILAASGRIDDEEGKPDAETE